MVTRVLVAFIVYEILKANLLAERFGLRAPTQRRLLESEEDFVEVLTAHPITVDATVNCAIRDLVVRARPPSSKCPSMSL